MNVRRFPAGGLGALFAVKPHGPWGKCRLVCIGITWRRLLAAGTARDRRPRTEELNLEARQYEVLGSGGVEHVALRARKHYGVGNWII